VLRFEYSKSSKQFVSVVFSFISTLSALLLFYSQSIVLAITFIVLTLTPTLYLAIWRAKLNISGLKGIRRRIREKRS